MTTSAYVPDVQVEIAFDSGWSTPAASRTWTDVSAYVELADGISIGVGRGDEFATADANTLNLVLDNSDGRFTAGLSSSPYYPNVKVGRPIRVTATPPAGGGASTRFVGYVDEWPVAWDGTVTYAKAQVAASSRTSRLGLTAPLGNLVSEQFALAGTMLAHYQLDDRVDRLGGPSLQSTGSGTAVDFDATGPGTDGLSAAQFAGGKYLAADRESVTVTAATGWWVECFFAAALTSQPLMEVQPSAIQLFVDASGSLSSIGLSTLDSGTADNDGSTHHALYAVDSVNGERLFLDGALVGSAGLSGSVTVDQIIIGRTSGLGTTVLTGTVAHAVIGEGVLTAGEVADRAAAGLTGFAGDTPAERIARYAEYLAIPTVEQSLATGTTPIGHIDAGGQSALSLMQKVAETDGGVLFDARDGTLTYQARGARYLASAALTLDAAAQEIEADYVAKMDRSVLTNTVDAVGIDASAHAVDQDSVDEYGLHSEQLDLATEDETELHGAAWWRVNNFAEPMLRVPTLSVDLLPFSTADKDAILGVTVGSRVTVTGLPAQAAASSDDYFVEGYTETIGPDQYVLTFNVSPADPYLTTWVLDSATRSQLGTTTRLAY